MNRRAALLTLSTLFAATAMGCASAEVEVKSPPPPVEEPVEKVTLEPKPQYISISDQIRFETGNAVLLPQSKDVLDDVAIVLYDNPGIRLVEIEGHTDSTGLPLHNLRLSQQRAQAVKRYLIHREIEGARLKAKGYGQDDPIADNDSEDGREQNRRVEFRIIEQDG